jgi:hypothetical protein
MVESRVNAPERPYRRVRNRMTATRMTAAATTNQIEPFGSLYASTNATAKPAAITTAPATIRPS